MSLAPAAVPQGLHSRRGGSFASWLKGSLLGRWASHIRSFLRGLIPLLEFPVPEEAEWMRRITIMERDVILPIKAAAVSMLLYSFYFTPWFKNVSSALDLEIQYTQYFLWIYIAVNLVMAALLMAMKQLPSALVQWSVYAMSLMDGIFLSTLVVVTGGYNSMLYWLFLGLIVRGAVSVPRATSQILLNLTLSACYLLAGFVDVFVAENLGGVPQARAYLNLSEEAPPESVVMRLILLLLMTACCYGVQVLLERQREAEEEAREFGLREGQLRSAGRLAAEFVHQIKNPLAIINNAIFSLQRALREGRSDVAEQISIIQEEVARSDRIITEVMGYAQLSEGRVEKLDVLEELNLAIDRVFPPAAEYPVAVHRDFGSRFPPLLMLRRHLSETFVNLLQNARDALGESGGSVYVSARCTAGYDIEVTIRDDGPGISRDKHEKVFEAYYTTREKGTGLGLATVKHNVELYGGSVRVQSELGKGAEFILVFPARTVRKSAVAN